MNQDEKILPYNIEKDAIIRLGNDIGNDKLRAAFFKFALDTAGYIRDFHDKDVGDEEWTLKELADMLVKESMEIRNYIYENLDEDDWSLFPFDIGHRTVHLIAKMDEHKKGKNVKENRS